jgi:hypothetical protein
MSYDTTDSVFGAWEALRRHLEARNRELNAEVAHYPTPIARCDVQLSKLLEQRARLYRELDRAASIGGLPPAGGAVGYWLDRVEHFILSAQADCDDADELALRRDLKRAIASQRRRAMS